MAEGCTIALSNCVAAAPQHLRTICEFSLNRPPMRAKVDRQSFDELKPGVERAIALLEWYKQLQQLFVDQVRALTDADASAPALTALVEALDACIVLENQFGGWSACVNRFSWFKRTFGQIRREVAQDGIDCDQLQKDISRVQTFIGDVSFPIGMHMTGPLRKEVKRVPGHERPLLAALFQLVSAASEPPAPSQLRPLPYLLYLCDGDVGGGSYNVFGARLSAVQKVFRKHPMAECAPPAQLVAELELPAGHPVHLGTVLSRCPHYLPSMRTKWGMPKAAGEDTMKCALL